MAPGGHVGEMKKETHLGDLEGTNQYLSLSPTTENQTAYNAIPPRHLLWSPILTLQSLPSAGSLLGTRYLSSINGTQPPEFQNLWAVSAKACSSLALHQAETTDSHSSSTGG